MPWSISKSDSCPADKPWAVISASGKKAGCHDSKASAMKQMRLLYMKLNNGEIAGAEEMPLSDPLVWEVAMEEILAWQE